MFDLDHPFFLPVWRRYATIAVCALWFALELGRGDWFWVVLSGAIGLFAAKALVFTFDEDRAKAKSTENSRDDAP